MAQQFFEELSRCLRKEQIESRNREDWRFSSMANLSFLFPLGMRFSCFRLEARIRRPTSYIIGLPLQPT